MELVEGMRTLSLTAAMYPGYRTVFFPVRFFPDLFAAKQLKRDL